eukprot:TRINITY_DN4994_c0_g1_i1.p1 TRINITY_DN4994_c0_g1~~TRINITY_DN4994_c0_g1_i1.p1  ORF type:complete len:887 (+),score=139.11 TRINITY_DN4994_c0_g1_i1:90-2750(+)
MGLVDKVLLVVFIAALVCAKRLEQHVGGGMHPHQQLDTKVKKYIVELQCAVIDEEGSRRDGLTCDSRPFVTIYSRGGSVPVKGDEMRQDEKKYTSDDVTPCAKKVKSCSLDAMRKYGAGPQTCQDFCTDPTGSRPVRCRWGIDKDRGESQAACQAGDKVLVVSGTPATPEAIGHHEEVSCQEKCESRDRSFPSYFDQMALWQTCGQAHIAGSASPCCPSVNKSGNCIVDVISVKPMDEILDDDDAAADNRSVDAGGIAVPRQDAATLFPFIASARYTRSSFVYSPASRFNSRETPVTQACTSWLMRVSELVRKKRLPLLMGWDPNGYFDVYRRFDKSKEYSPSIKAAFLSVLLNQQVTDPITAQEVWDQWIEPAAEAAEALYDGNENGYSDRSWSEALDEMLTGGYSVLRELESDVTLIQSIAMSQGVQARQNEMKVRSYHRTAVISIGFILVSILTGGFAAGFLPAVAGLLAYDAGVAGSLFAADSRGLVKYVTNLVWLGGMRLGFVAEFNSLADKKKTSADKFGQTHKQLSWLRYQKEWIEQFLEADARDAFANAQARMRLRESVKKDLICSRQAGSPQAPEYDKEDGKRDCPFATVDQLKASLLASWVNFVTIDGGCVAPPDMDTPFVHSPSSAFSAPDDVACCANTLQAGRCMVRSLRGDGSGRACPDGWQRVSREWSFGKWQTDGRALPLPSETETCCGVLGTMPDIEFDCGVPDKCAAEEYAAPFQERDSIFGHIVPSPFVNSACTLGPDEDRLRAEFCKKRARRSSGRLCLRALSFARCESRRFFCKSFSSLKHTWKLYIDSGARRCWKELAAQSNATKPSQPGQAVNEGIRDPILLAKILPALHTGNQTTTTTTTTSASVPSRWSTLLSSVLASLSAR